MKTYIALFRGMNIGGKNIVRMDELRSILERLGLNDIKTYLQSGNAVFRSDETDAPKLADRISEAIEKKRGFKPRALLLEEKDLEKAIESNPFPEAESNPKALALMFPFSPPADPDFKTLDDLKTKTEKYKLIGNVFYLFAPDGFGRSKLATGVEKCLRVPTTGRNWRTVRGIREMLSAK